MLDDLRTGRLGDGDHLGQPPRHLPLHAGEPVPAPQGQTPPADRVGQLQPPVDLHRMVDRGHQRQAQPGQPEQAVAEALVVVHDVVAPWARPQQSPGPQGERQRLGEPGGHHRGHLDDIHPVAVLPPAGHPERVGLPVQVEARYPGQGHPILERRVRLAGEDVHVVPQADQFPAQVAHVDALAAAEGVAPVAEQGDAQRLVGHGMSGTIAAGVPSELVIGSTRNWSSGRRRRLPGTGVSSPVWAGAPQSDMA